MKLMNSAMMPQHGVYVAREMDEFAFVHTLQEAHKAGALESFIGYEATAKHIEAISGVPVSVSRAAAVLDRCDSILVCKLAYRVSDPGTKADRSRVPGASDYVYMLVTYVAL